MIPTSPIETDYLVIGAGAGAMAFVDTLLSETQARILMVDRHHRPGGHWNDDYSFVRLHQPSAYYGVPSRPLPGAGARDRQGPNLGFYAMASGPELLAYYDRVMRERFLPTGRVRYFPQCDHLGEENGIHRFRALLTGTVHEAVVRRKVVDATLTGTEVPSTHPPRYEVAPGVACMPPNALPDLKRAFERYTVVGGGKTGIDVCLWLLEQGIDPDRIRWIRPRDPLLHNRFFLQPGPDFFSTSLGYFEGLLDAAVASTSVADFLARVERGQFFLRIDPDVAPTSYRGAIVSMGELELLRSIREVVRMGHVRALEPDRIHFTQGDLASSPDTLHIDCSARGFALAPAEPVFSGNRINLRMIYTVAPLFSFATIAYLESHFSDPAELNALAAMVPLPNEPADILRMLCTTLANQERWSRHEVLRSWLLGCRLNPIHPLLQSRTPRDPALFTRLRAALLRSRLNPLAARMRGLEYLDLGVFPRLLALELKTSAALARARHLLEAGR